MRARAFLDATGLVLVILWLAWIVARGSGSEASWKPFQLVALCGVTLWAARQVTRVRGWLIPLVVVTAAAVALASAGTEVVTGGPLAEPFGYANANAAFFIQASIAGLMAFRLAGRLWLRVVSAGAAVVFAAVPVLGGSRTAVGIVLLLIPCALLLQRLRSPRTAVVWCGVVWVFALVSTIWLGARYTTEPSGDQVLRSAAAALSERRLILWHEALDIAKAQPITGVGSGQFAAHSPTARADRDARWAHNEFLQHAAEVGIPGLLLMSAVFAWGFARLLAGIPRAPHAVLGAGSLAALGAHACIDYILHFPAVVLIASALLGAGMTVAAERRAGSELHDVPWRAGIRPVNRPGCSG